MHSRCSSTSKGRNEAPHTTPPTHVPIHRVAAAAKLKGVPVDLHPIETALHQLLNASLALDYKKKLTLQHLQRSRPIHVRIHASVLDQLKSFISHLSCGTSVPDRFG